MDLETSRKTRRFSKMSIEGHCLDDTNSHSPPQMSSLQTLQVSAFESQMQESQVSEVPVDETERSHLRGLGIHASGQRSGKAR